jgi:DNA-directed RNA polymerase
LDFDVLLKLRVLHQLSVWTFWNADRIRDKMPEKKESEQLQWVSCAFLAERKEPCPC